VIERSEAERARLPDLYRAASERARGSAVESVKRRIRHRQWSTISMQTASTSVQKMTSTVSSSVAGSRVFDRVPRGLAGHFTPGYWVGSPTPTCSEL
jgi:hypothetical protein